VWRESGRVFHKASDFVKVVLPKVPSLREVYLCYNKCMEAQRPVNSPTVQAHKRQFAWQILLPFLVAAVVILIAAVLVSTGAASTTRTWADVSIIWLIIPMLSLALFCVIELGFLIYGVARLLKIMPHYTSLIQDFFVLISARARMIADGSAKPFVLFKQAGAVLRSIFKR
jgi:hypothetical protein